MILLYLIISEFIVESYENAVLILVSRILHDISFIFTCIKMYFTRLKAYFHGITLSIFKITVHYMTIKTLHKLAENLLVC